jgi:hypothetical protein
VIPGALVGAAIGVVVTAALAAGPRSGASQEAGAASPQPPKASSISYYSDALDQGVVRPLTRAGDPALWVRKLTGNHREAANVDEQDQVRLPSTWWQPRLGFRPVTPEQMRRGPGPGAGPRRDAKWRVTGLKTQGVSLGIRIKDSEGQTYQLKFDPPKWPEMATGADAVASRLFWAAGYNVSDNVVVEFVRDDLQVDGGGTYTDAFGRKRPITWEIVDEILAKVPRSSGGGYRAVASAFLKGKPLGEWKYRGRRSDDPEDLIPHQHRREIRGLYTIAAWLNHTDGSARNTLDMWVTEGGRSFVRHYLLDYSGCLGSGSIDRQTYASGTEHLVDYGTISTSLVSLGLRPFRWESTVDPQLPAVGFFETVAFDPADWRPFLPNPAYDERTERDVRWGARIVAAFTDEHIRAAVALGRYSDPRAEEYIVRTLIERRDKVVRRFLSDSMAETQRP